jgi:hypothetical protein
MGTPLIKDNTHEHQVRTSCPYGEQLCRRPNPDGWSGQPQHPQEKVHELGNYQSVGIVGDIPDLTFSLDCLDVDTEIEGLLTGSVNPTADAESTMYNLGLSKPLDILSPWKSPYGDFAIVRGVAIPNLALESASYKYGLKENAGETFSLKGDSIFYIPGIPYQGLEDLMVRSAASAHIPAGLTGVQTPRH